MASRFLDRALRARDHAGPVAGRRRSAEPVSRVLVERHHRADARLRGAAVRRRRAREHRRRSRRASSPTSRSSRRRSSARSSRAATPIVHMATHAQFESDYRRSFLLAHDDVITMDELEDVMGSQRFSDRPVDLLVLERVPHRRRRRARGARARGRRRQGRCTQRARVALVRQRRIDGAVDRRVLSAARRRARARRAALRGAQLLLINDERYRTPAYWAPFLMIGDWR